MKCICPKCQEAFELEISTLKVKDRETAAETIQAICAKWFKVPYHLLSARTRKSDIAAARHVAMYFILKYCDFTKVSIGLRFGGMHHASVIHAEERCDHSYDTKRDLYDDLVEIEKIIINSLPLSLKKAA